ncbi:MAG: DNA repair protein RecN [Pseudomonadota bacterium]
MLRGLEIRDLLIIDHLELEVRPGLNVLTGETGAGKSILLDALGFVLGWRGRAELVRAGVAQGEVTAWFDLAPGHAARDVLEEVGLPVRDELILRRVNTAEGRKTAWVNERRASGEVLRALSDTLVELHGQQDDRGLLNPRGHRMLLDSYAGVGAELTAVRSAWRAWRAAVAELDTARDRLADLQKEEAFLRHAAEELAALAPEPGEAAALEERRRLMKAARGLGQTIAAAHAAVGDEAAGRLLLDALRGLEGVAAQSEGALDGAIDALARAVDVVADAEREVAEAAERLSFDPSELERVEDRFHAYRDLAKKHRVAEDDLAALAERVATELQALEMGAADLSDLEGRVSAAHAAYCAAAEMLGAKRRAAAVELDQAMAAELAPLKMERAVFVTEVSETEAGPEGSDDVVFTVATNPGTPPGPLSRIASGGELSRFLLALKVCLLGPEGGRTMIFDEIDRGVGGATAAAVGKRLKRLAEDSGGAGGQVLVVTHSPQVAAMGGHHWRVDKRVNGGTTLSTVTPLDPGARVDELARMLAGDRITDEARAAARALLEG